MRFKINLASQPYENAQRFFFQWGVALIALFIVSGLLVFASAKSWRISHSLARSVDDERKRLDKLTDQENKDKEILDKAQNRDVRDRAVAINSLIVRKEFSWTRIFSDLEKMMPTRLHVLSIMPQLTQADQIEIRMQVGGDSREKAIELLQNLEKAPDFRDARITSENSAQKGGGGDPITVEITALYVPSAAAAISEAEKANSVREQQPSPANKESEAKSEKQQPKPLKATPAPLAQNSAAGEHK